MSGAYITSGKEGTTFIVIYLSSDSFAANTFLITAVGGKAIRQRYAEYR